ncbi:MAG: hypothetical protein KBS70_04425 [Bacteroidales bacterium]|nr:hypothetical protein [Candidatus Colicola equi]
MRPRSATTSWLNKFKLLAFAFMALLSINQVWGADTPTTPSADFTAKTYGNSVYNSSLAYGDWTIVNGANNNKGWTYFKMGGKSATISSSNPCYIYSTTGSAAAVGKVTVHLPSGSLSKSGMSVNSWGVYVYSNSTLTTQVDYVAGGTITNSEGSFNFTPSPGKTWPKGSYFKVNWNLANTTTTNGIICVDKITLYEATASTYTVNFSGQKSGHFQPSFLALS